MRSSKGKSESCTRKWRSVTFKRNEESCGKITTHFIAMAQYIQKIYSAIVCRMICSLEKSVLCCVFRWAHVSAHGETENWSQDRKKVLLFSLRPVWTWSLWLLSCWHSRAHAEAVCQFFFFFFKTAAEGRSNVSHIHLLPNPPVRFIYFLKMSHLLPSYFIYSLYAKVEVTEL